MILVRMMGGLGNQLFQFSFARHLERELGKPVWLDLAYYVRHRVRSPVLGKLGIEYRKTALAGYLWYRLNSGRFLRYEEKTFLPDVHLDGSRDDAYFWGYWQRAEYASAGRKDVLDGFRRFPKRAVVQDLERRILDTDSTSIHVRRGDYRGIPKFALLTREYYASALDAVAARDSESWFVFSDETRLEQGLLPAKKDVVYISAYGLKDYEEFYLMSLCRRNICANSTFSWWAAFLNEREGRKAAVPAKWKTREEDFRIQDYLFPDLVVL